MLSGAGRRAKGARFRRLIRDYLDEAGMDPIARSDGEDGDDIRIALPSISIELKGSSQPRLGEWIRQASSQAGERIPVLIWKRHGRGAPGSQWVTLELGQFVRLLRLLATADHRDWRSVAGRFEHGVSGEGLAPSDVGVPDCTEEP